MAAKSPVNESADTSVSLDAPEPELELEPELVDVFESLLQAPMSSTAHARTTSASGRFNETCMMSPP
jgi:hypothetical protein